MAKTIICKFTAKDWIDIEPSEEKIKRFCLKQNCSPEEGRKLFEANDLWTGHCLHEDNSSDIVKCELNKKYQVSDTAFEDAFSIHHNRSRAGKFIAKSYEVYRTNELEEIDFCTEVIKLYFGEVPKTIYYAPLKD